LSDFREFGGFGFFIKYSKSGGAGINNKTGRIKNLAPFYYFSYDLTYFAAPGEAALIYDVL
jgi:hypothetical protein